jgi:hypothetical protein
MNCIDKLVKHSLRHNADLSFLRRGMNEQQDQDQVVGLIDFPVKVELNRLEVDGIELFESDSLERSIREIREKIEDELVKEFDDKLKDVVIAELRELGHVFYRDSDLFRFIKNRVTRARGGRNYWELRLDYNGPDDPGELLCSYNCQVTYETEGRTIHAVIKNPIIANRSRINNNKKQ